MENSFWRYFRQLFISSKKQRILIYLNSGTNFGPLKTEITRFPNGCRLNAFVITAERRKSAYFLLSTLKPPGNHASRIPKPVLQFSYLWH